VIRLALRVRRADAELVLAELLELAPGGVEEVDVDAGTVEYAVYGSPGELPELPDLRAAAGGALVDLSSREIADDWAERWREFHRPLVLGDRLCVRPPWEPVPTSSALVPTSSALRVSPGGETSRSRSMLDIVIDPGRAFGTGAHATTRLCLELLLEVSPARGLISRPPGFGAVDLGCGSGVLAIAAARLGHAPVLALDFDPLSVEATLANAAINGVADELQVRRFDLRAAPVPAAPLVLANLLAPLLRDWCAQLAQGTAAVPARVIASGLLATEADAASADFAGVGLLERERRIRGEWAALLLVAHE
jgi:ribosomal protein L11 methyltransferase